MHDLFTAVTEQRMQQTVSQLLPQLRQASTSLLAALLATSGLMHNADAASSLGLVLTNMHRRVKSTS